MSQVSDFGHGFNDALEHNSFGGNWTMTNTLMVVGVVLVVLAAMMSQHIFTRYRQHIRARRKESKKRAFLGRLLYDPNAAGAAETDLLKSMVKYYMMTEVPAGLAATPDQLLHFSKRLFRMIRETEFDKRGRLVVPALEKQWEEMSVESLRHPQSKSLDPAAHGASEPAWRGIRASSKESMSNAAKVALSMIRTRSV